MNKKEYTRPTFEIDQEQLQKAIDFLAPRSVADHHALEKRIKMLHDIYMVFEDANFDIEFSANNDDAYYYNSAMMLALNKMSNKLKETV